MKTSLRALTASSVLLLAACLEGDKDDGFTTSSVIEVLDIDRDAGTLETREIRVRCEDGEPVTGTRDFVENYQITGGRLYRWDDMNECSASITTGNSKDIVGT